MNRVELVGRLVRDPDYRVSQSGNGVTRFTLAIDRIRKADGQPEADFPSCIAFGKTAEYLDKYIKKGFLVSVEGRIQTGSYTDQETNKKVYTTDILCDSVQNLTPRQQNVEASQEPTQEYQSANDNNVLDISSDDLPFSSIY